MIVTLVGMMGSGKSTVGKLVSEKLNYKFYDTDSLIVEKTGRKITDIFRIKGEEYFRDLEKEVINELYNKNDIKNSVIATGGGAVLSEANRNLFLNRSKVYWLNVEVDKLADRLYENKERPLIRNYKNRKSDLVNHLDNILNDRIDYYQIGIEINGTKKPSQIAIEIMNDIKDEGDIIE